MRPAIGHADLVGHIAVSRISIRADDPFGVLAQMSLWNRGRARGIQDVGARVTGDDDPQPPAVADLARHFGENHPACLVHVPVIGRAAMLQYTHVERAEQFAKTPQTAGQGAWGDVQPFQLKPFEDPV
jgi:hypothetical protein